MVATLGTASARICAGGSRGGQWSSHGCFMARGVTHSSLLVQCGRPPAAHAAAGGGVDDGVGLGMGQQGWYVGDMPRRCVPSAATKDIYGWSVEQ
jgi:hypothetical protein